MKWVLIIGFLLLACQGPVGPQGEPGGSGDGEAVEYDSEDCETLDCAWLQEGMIVTVPNFTDAKRDNEVNDFRWKVTEVGVETERNTGDARVRTHVTYQYKVSGNTLRLIL